MPIVNIEISKSDLRLLEQKDSSSKYDLMLTKALEETDKASLLTDNFKIPINDNYTQYLALAGAGGKGYSYLGALYILFLLNLIKHIKAIACTSAGGIASLPLALGFTYEEILKYVAEIDFNSIKDMDDTNFWVKYGFKSIKIIQDLLGNNAGIYEGNKVANLFRWFIYLGVGDPDATFADLKKAREGDPSFKDLYITAYNLNANELQIFSAKTTPKVRLFEALTATMSLPFVFKPVLIEVNGKKSWFMDGGIALNNPMPIFDGEAFLNKDYGLTQYSQSNPCSLGFVTTNDKTWSTFDEPIYNENIQQSTTGNSKESIKSTDNKHGLSDLEELENIAKEFEIKQSKDINASDNKGEPSLIDIVNSLIESSIARQKHDLEHKYDFNVVRIYDCGHSTIDFNFPPLVAEKLIASGKNATTRYFSLYRDGDQKADKEIDPGRIFYDHERNDGNSKRTEKKLDITIDLLIERMVRLRIQLENNEKSGKYNEKSPNIASLKQSIEDVKNHQLYKENKDYFERIVDEAYKIYVINAEKLDKEYELKGKENTLARQNRGNILELSKNNIVSGLFLDEIGIKGNAKLLELLIKLFPFSVYKAVILGANLDGTQNLLTLAAANKHNKIIEMLVDLERSYTIKQLIEKEYEHKNVGIKNKPEEMKLLIEKESKLLHGKSLATITTKDGKTAIYSAAINDNFKGCKLLLLLSNKVDLNKGGPSEQSTILAVAKENNAETLNFLLDLQLKGELSEKIDLAKKDSSGQTLLHYIIKYKNEVALQHFFSIINKNYFGGYTEYTSIPDNDNATPLHLLATIGDVKLWDIAEKNCVRLGVKGFWEMKHIFNLFAIDNNKKNPLQIAQENSHNDLASRK